MTKLNLKEKVRILEEAQKNFYSFTKNIFAKSFTNFVGGDYIEESCNHLSKYDRTMRIAFRSGFKCLKKDTPIWLSNGRIKKIQEIQPGDRILGFKKGRIISTKVKRQEATGYKKLLKITTENGKEILASPEHQFLTDRGWKEASSLTRETFLLSNKKETYEGKEIIKDDEIKFLAYIIGDGQTAQYDINFTNQNKKIQDEFIQISTSLGFETYFPKENRIRIKGGKQSIFLKKYGLFAKKSIEKQIPIQIKESSNRQIALFINRLWSCDGRIKKDWNTGAIFLNSGSKKLVKDLMLLFGKLGINTKYTEYVVKLWNGTLYNVYRVSVGKALEQEKFLEKIGLIYGKEKDSKEVKDSLKKRTRARTEKIPISFINLPKEIIEKRTRAKLRSSLYMLKKCFPSHDFDKYLMNDFQWEKVSMIEKIGTFPTYDIETDSHNYLVEGIVVHNSTALYSKIMYDIMFRGIKEDLDIRYFSYSYDLAGWHIQQVKSHIDKNPYFKELKNLKSLAENTAKYTWDNQHFINIRPVGVISFSRGLKAMHIYCVPGDTRIEYLGGSKPIKDIKVGEMVKTHKGRYRRVTRKFERPFWGYLHEILTKYSKLDLTKEHLILVSRPTKDGTKVLWRKPVARSGRIIDKQLKIGDRLHYPLDYKESRVYWSEKKSNKGLKEQWVTKDFAWWMGHYAAEGSTTSGKIAISKGTHEKELIEKVRKLMKRFFGSSWITGTGSAKQITSQSNGVSLTLKRLFGTNALEKRIPKQVFDWDFERRTSFFIGLIDGDGHYFSSGAIRLKVSSKQLFNDTLKLLSTLGVSPTIGKVQISTTGYSSKNPQYTFYLNAIDSNKLRTIYKENFEVKNIRKKRNQRKDHKVYNLEVEEDNTYIANGFVVHNCDDLLSDPANPIHPTVILKIDNLFRSVILESLKPGGEIHVVGSPLSLADFYYDTELQKEFHTIFRPAIKKDKDGNEVPTWPEFYTLEQIKAKIPVMTERIFAAEMMLVPYLSTDSFFKKEQLRKTIVNSSLRNIRLIEGLDTENLVVAGLDIGKKKHPSVLNVFEIKDGKAIQIHRKKMVKWPYYTAKPYNPLHPSQVEYCVPGNTRIDIWKGSKEIREIRVGDKVKTHLGNFKRVTKIYKRRIWALVCKLKTKYQTLYLTKDHRILSSAKDKTTGYYSAGKSWRPARRIKPGYLLHYPKNFKKPKLLYFLRPQKGQNGKRFEQKMLSIDLAWLFGIYTAEGSSPKRRIYFTFGSHELNLIKKTKEFLIRYFGQAKEDKHHSWATNIYVNSVGLSKTFKKWFGSNAREKHVPFFILQASERYKASFLKGLIEGDGSIREVITFVSASKQLRNQFVQLCNDLSISCYSISEGKNVSPQGKNFYIYRCSIRKIDWNKILTLAEDEFEVISNKEVLLKEERLREFKHVYNLEVEDDNSYIANGFIVHNCKEAIKNFGIDALYYDNTRGEFEGAKDSGLLTTHFIDIILPSQGKFRVQLTTDFEKVVMNKQIELFDDEDMLNSICSVTNDLVSIETIQGHGDDFWGIALALIGFQSSEVSGKQDKEIRTGSPSIFGEDGWKQPPIPKNW